MNIFKINFTFCGHLDVRAENEQDAIRKVRHLNHGSLLERIDPDSLVVHGGNEVDIGGES